MGNRNKRKKHSSAGQPPRTVITPTSSLPALEALDATLQEFPNTTPTENQGLVTPTEDQGLVTPTEDQGLVTPTEDQSLMTPTEGQGLVAPTEGQDLVTQFNTLIASELEAKSVNNLKELELISPARTEELTFIKTIIELLQNSKPLNADAITRGAMLLVSQKINHSYHLRTPNNSLVYRELLKTLEPFVDEKENDKEAIKQFVDEIKEQEIAEPLKSFISLVTNPPSLFDNLSFFFGAPTPRNSQGSAISLTEEPQAPSTSV